MTTNDLGIEGRALWDAVTAELELEPHELHLLRLACQLTDVFAALLTVITADGVMVKSRLGADVANPAAKEARAQAMAINALLRSIQVRDGQA